MKDTSKKRSGKLQPNGPPLIPPEVIPDQLKVPKDTILLVPDAQDFVDPPIFTKAGQHRDWFDPYFYHCLPLVMGNQYGFLMLATHGFVCRWNGSDAIDAVSIHMLDPVSGPGYLILESHFGFGILTVQSRYIFRTPNGVNLMVKEPPNYPIHGFSWMNAVVETDSLRRDFTFNIKITQPHLDIYIPRGTPLGCLLPYPRYFLDGYNMEELKDQDELRKSERTVSYFARERDDFDASPRHRYMEGVDIYNIEFKHHQKTLDQGKWWFSKERKKHIPLHLSEKAVEYSDKSLLSNITNIFRKFLLLTSNAMRGEESSNSQNGETQNYVSGQLTEETAAQAIRDSSPLHGKKVVSPGEKKFSEEPIAKCPVKHDTPSTARADTAKNLDHSMGHRPDETPACPHSMSSGASGSILESPATTSIQTSPGLTPQKGVTPNSEKVIVRSSVPDTAIGITQLVQNARQALNRGDAAESERLLCQAAIKSVQENSVGVDLISAMHALGYYYVQKPDLDKALSILTQTMTLCNQAHHLEPARLAGILRQLAYVEHVKELLPAAEEHYAAALEIWTAMKDEVNIASGMFFLGILYDQMGRLEDSEPLLQEAFDTRKQKLGEKHPDTLSSMNGIACLYTHQRRYAEAERMFATVIASRSEVLGADALELAESYNDLGFLHLANEKLSEAEDAFKRAAAIRAQRTGEESPGVAEFLKHLAFAYRQHKNFPQAKEYFEKVLAIKEKCLPAKHPEVVRATEDLAHAYLDLGDKNKADELFQRTKP